MIRSSLFWGLALGGVGVFAAGLLLGSAVTSGRFGAPLVFALALLTVGVVGIVAGRLARRVQRLLAKTGLSGAPETAGGDELARLESRLEANRLEFLQQVEELKADRSQLTAVLGGMVEGVVAIDLDRRVLHLNAVAAKWFGRAAPESAVGRPIYELSRQPEISGALIEAMEKRCRVSRSFVQAGSAGVQGGSAGVEIAARKFELNASPLLSSREDGERVEGAVAVIGDISELERLEGIRRDFVSNVSHELKTPLTAIHGYVETLIESEEMDLETRARFLHKVRAQSSRLSALVSDLLTLSRIESSVEAPDQILDLRQPVDEVLSLLRPTGEARGLELIAECPDRPVTVRGEEEAIRQALSNLVDNALKYSATGGRVLVRLHAANGRAVLEVRDQGPGIGAEHLDRIFERFYRADRARSRELGGTGLGLSIVKNVVQRHGGGVEVESEPGRGATFRFWLPTAD